MCAIVAETRLMLLLVPQSQAADIAAFQLFLEKITSFRTAGADGACNALILRTREEVTRARYITAGGEDHRAGESVIQVQSRGKLAGVEVNIQRATFYCHRQHTVIGLVESLSVGQI